MPSDKLHFDANGLYIILSDIGALDQFHWGYYLAVSENHGRLYHLINNKDTGYKWKYDSHPTHNVPKSKALLVAHKIAVMDPALHAPLGEMLEAVSDAPPVTCRIWLLRALQELDDAGFIKLTAEPGDIERDAEGQAAENRLSDRRTIEYSNWSAA
ncbi:hypothetical protein BJX64DRAFT_270156 [Aspergillus heterothallicus]